MIKFSIIGLVLSIFFVWIIKHAHKAYSIAHDLTHPVMCNYSNIIHTYEKFEFITADGVKLSGIEYMPVSECKGTILVCHYLGGSKESVLMFVEALIRNGYRVLSFDNRNHGESDTVSGIKVSLRTDFDAFYSEIIRRGISGPFGIMGFSMGAGQALWAIDKYSNIKAAIIDSGPLINVKRYFNYVLDINMIKNRITRGIFLFLFLYYIGFLKVSKKTKKILKELCGKQILLIHGENDNTISVEDAKFALSLLRPGSAELWIVPRSKHLTNRCLSQDEYDERIVYFFDRNIIGQ